MQFQATINADITHKAGPTISGEHIAAWLCSEAAEVGVGYGYLTVTVCSAHPGPDDCHDGCTAPYSKYRIVFDAVTITDH